MSTTAWKRLVRFIAKEDGKEYLGEPLDTDLDIGAALASPSSSPVLVNVLNATTALDTKATFHTPPQTLTISRVVSPLTRGEVGAIRCVGLNYRNHAREMNLSLPQHPTLFFKPPTCLNDPNAPLIIPHQATDGQADYEAELAVAIGPAPTRNVAVANALDYVLGYVCANDVTARKHQMNGAQWGFGKGFDGFAPLGPCLVSAHHGEGGIPDPSVVELRTELNGEVVQEGRADDMIFSVAEIVSYLSQGTTLEPGTVILTGTPAGIGAGKTPPLFLRDGDDLRVVMSHGLGSLVSRVEYEAVPVGA